MSTSPPPSSVRDEMKRGAKASNGEMVSQPISRKRKATEHQLQDQPKKRKLASKSEATPAQPFKLPEPGSINSIIGKNNRIRLVVPPIIWTEDHPRLLGCAFAPHELPSEAESSGCASLTTEKTTNTVLDGKREILHQRRIRNAQHLQKSSGRQRKVRAIGRLMYVDGIDLKVARPDGGFEVGRKRATVSLDGAYRAGPAGVIGILHLDTLDTRRRDCFFGQSFESLSQPVKNLRRKRFDAMQPVNPAEDPFFAAALISLARGELAARQIFRSLCGSSSGIEVKLVVIPETNLKKTQDLLVYQTSFTPAFFDRLKNPARFVPCDPVEISYHKIPIHDAEKLTSYFPRVLGLPVDLKLLEDAAR